MKRFAFAVLATVAVAFAAVAVAEAYQYRGPNAPFPDGNPAAPLDTSQYEQFKDGALGFSLNAVGAVLKFQSGQSLSVGNQPFLLPLTGGNNKTVLKPGSGGLIITTDLSGATATTHVSNLCFGEDQTDCKSTWAGVGSGGSDSFWKLFPGGIEYASSANPGVSMGKGGALTNVSVTGNLSVSDGPNTRNTAYYYEQIAYTGTAPNTIYTTSTATFNWWKQAFPAEFGSANSWEAIRMTNVMTAGECEDNLIYSRQCRETIYSAPDEDPERNRFVYDLWMQQPVGEPGFSVGYTKFEKKRGTRAGGTLNAVNGSFSGLLETTRFTINASGTPAKKLMAGVAGSPSYAFLSAFDTSASQWLPLAIQGAPNGKVVIGTTTVAANGATTDTMLNVVGPVNATRYLVNGQPISSEDPRWSVVPGGIAYNGGSVGIGTGTSTGPTANLQVKGSVRISGTSPRITFGDGNVDSRVYGPGPLSPSNHPDLLSEWASEFGSSTPDTCDNNVGTAGGGTINGNTPPSGIYSCPGGVNRQCRDVYWGPANRGGTWVSGWFADKVICYANTDEVVSVANQGGTFTVNNKNEQARLSVSQSGVVTVSGPASTLSVMTGNGGFGGIYGVATSTHNWIRGLIGHGVDVTATGYRLASQYGGSLIYFGNQNWIGFSALATNAQNMTFTAQQLEDNATQFKVLLWGTETKGTAKVTDPNGAWLRLSGGASTLPAKYAGITFEQNGVNKWSLFKTDTAVNDLFVGRYDAGGSFVDAPLQISLASGTVTIPNGLKLPNGAAAGKVLTSDASGNAAWSEPPPPPQDPILKGFKPVDSFGIQCIDHKVGYKYEVSGNYARIVVAGLSPTNQWNHNNTCSLFTTQPIPTPWWKWSETDGPMKIEVLIGGWARSTIIVPEGGLVPGQVYVFPGMDQIDTQPGSQPYTVTVGVSSWPFKVVRDYYVNPGVSNGSWQDTTGAGNAGESCAAWLRRTNQWTNQNVPPNTRTLVTQGLGGPYEGQCVYNYTGSQIGGAITRENTFFSTDYRPASGGSSFGGGWTNTNYKTQVYR